MDILLDWSFLLKQVSNIFVLVAVQYCNGLLVLHKGVKVNYTRKINHFMLFFIPIYLNRGYAYEADFFLYFLGAFMAVAKFIFYTRPVRDRVPLIRTMFHSFDRPEDRPRTLLWIVTQTASGYMVLLPMGVLFAYYDLLYLMLIPILIYGIGDGLAEPVGVRFGRHKYPAYALFTGKEYFRTLEGSSMVFLTSVVVVLAFHSYFTTQQLIVALLALPVIMTLAEAFSPHTWDSPIMFLVGYMILFGIKMI